MATMAMNGKKGRVGRVGRIGIDERALLAEPIDGVGVGNCGKKSEREERAKEPR